MKLWAPTTRTVLGSLAIALAVTVLSAAGRLEKFENLVYDGAHRLEGERTRPPDLILAAIDEASLRQIGRWPWPRKRIAELLEAIASGGPAVIGVDIGFFEPDRERPDDDRRLVAATELAGNVIYPVYLAARPSLGEITAFQEPFPSLARAAAGLGHVHTEPSLDGVIRKIYLRQELGGDARPAFGLVVAAEFLRRTGREGSIRERDGFLELGETAIPAAFRRPDLRGPEAGLIGQEYPLYIRFAGPAGTFLRLPAWEILRPGFPREIFREKIVLVGATAPGLGDLAMTPLSAERNPMPGVEIQANVISTILSGEFVTRPPFSRVAALIFLVSLAAGWFFDRRAGRGALLGFLGLLAGIAGLYLLLLLRFRIWLEIWPLAIAVTGSYLLVSGGKLAFLFRSLDEEISALSRREQAPSPESRTRGPAGEPEQLFAFLSSLMAVDRALLILYDRKGKNPAVVETWGDIPRLAAGAAIPEAVLAGRDRPRQLNGPEMGKIYPAVKETTGSWILLPLGDPPNRLGFLVLGRSGESSFRREEIETGRTAARQLGYTVSKDRAVLRRGLRKETPVDFFRRAGLERKIRTLRSLSRSLAAERSLLSAMLAGITDGVMVTDLLGGVLLVNQPAGELLAELGESPERIRVMDLLSRLLKLSREELAGRAREIIAGGKAFGTEVTIGDKTYLVSLAAFRGKEGPAGGLVAVFTEITYLKKLDQLRSETMAMLSHEIARPVSGIIGFCDLYSNQLVEPEEIPEYIEMIKNSAAGLRDLLRDYLAVARLEAGAEAVDREAIDPAGLIEEAVASASPRAAEKEITLEKDIPRPPPELRGDAKLLRRVLDNLIENAIRYSPAGSEVTIGCGRSGESVVFRVADRGPGIPEPEREKIFDKFYRGTKTRQIAGTGLGLSISRRIAEEHGGEITAADREGGGSVFSVFLPGGESPPGPG